MAKIKPQIAKRKKKFTKKTKSNFIKNIIDGLRFSTNKSTIAILSTMGLLVYNSFFGSVNKNTPMYFFLAITIATGIKILLVNNGFFKPIKVKTKVTKITIALISALMSVGLLYNISVGYTQSFVVARKNSIVIIYFMLFIISILKNFNLNNHKYRIHILTSILLFSILGGFLTSSENKLYEKFKLMSSAKKTRFLNSEIKKRKKGQGVDVVKLVALGMNKTLEHRASSLSVDDINYENRDGQTPLGMAVQNDDIEAVKTLLYTNKLDISKKTRIYPKLAENPYKYILSIFIKPLKVSPISVASRRICDILKKKEVVELLNDREIEQVETRIFEITDLEVRGGFVNRNKNNLIVLGTGLALSVSVFYIYKNYYKYLTFKNVLIGSLSILAVYGVSKYTDYLYDNALKNYLEVANIGKKQYIEMQDRYEDTIIFKRPVLVYELRKKLKDLNKNVLDKK